MEPYSRIFWRESVLDGDVKEKWEQSGQELLKERVNDRHDDALRPTAHWTRPGSDAKMSVA